MHSPLERCACLDAPLTHVAWEAADKMKGVTMNGDPVDLDERRGMAAQRSTESRRHLHKIQADQAALRHRQEEFEKFLLAAPAKTWPDVAAKAQYVLQLFAETPCALDPRRQELIASTLDDLTRAADISKESS